MAQDEQNCRPQISSAIFISDQPKLDYLKTRNLHRALFPHLNDFCDTLFHKGFLSSDRDEWHYDIWVLLIENPI